MSQNEDIIKKFEDCVRYGWRGAIATVVNVTGSSYRREGAKMLISETGNTFGEISGGCLESDVAETAKIVIESQESVQKKYNMNEDIVWGLGLGCPGVVDIYIEPLSELSLLYQAWSKCIKDRKFGVLATILESTQQSNIQNGSRMFISELGETEGYVENEYLYQLIKEISSNKLQEKAPKSETRILTFSNNEEATVFFDINTPVPELMIFGAGHDAIPVARLSNQLGYHTTVIDPRTAFATRNNFPESDIFHFHSNELKNLLFPHWRTNIVIMNHHMERDRICLQFALESPASYVGLLGPRRRKDNLLDQLYRDGVTFNSKQLSRLRNPIGVDVGAETSEEIAVSIFSELLAIKNQHNAGFLTDKQKIHQ